MLTHKDLKQKLSELTDGEFLLLINGDKDTMLHAFFINAKGEKCIYMPTSLISESSDYFQFMINDFIQFEESDKLIIVDFNTFNEWRRKGIRKYLEVSFDVLRLDKQLADIGKLVVFPNGESGMIIAITSTDEDFYNVLLTPNGNITFTSMLAKYKIVPDDVLTDDLGRCKTMVENEAKRLENTLYDKIYESSDVIVCKPCFEITEKLKNLCWNYD